MVTKYEHDKVELELLNEKLAKEMAERNKEPGNPPIKLQLDVRE